MSNFSKDHVRSLADSLRRRQTRHEKMLWRELRGKYRSLGFRRQVAMRSYILDFYSDRFSIGIEVDGMGHDKARDILRDNRIYNETGVSILRFSNADVEYRMVYVLENIAKACSFDEKSTHAQGQHQQQVISNNINKHKINLRSYWHGGNVDKNGNIPDVSELSGPTCERLVKNIDRSGPAFFKREPCNKQPYSSEESAQFTVRAFKSLGMNCQVERCGNCGLIHLTGVRA